MLAEYGSILVLFCAAGVFILGILPASRLIRPKTHDRGNKPADGSGIPASGAAAIRINFRFCVYALLFVIFETASLYLFLWAAAVQKIGAQALVEMGAFLCVLITGLLYAWKTNALRWE